MKKKIVKKTVWMLMDKSTKKIRMNDEPWLNELIPPYWMSRQSARCVARSFKFECKPVKATIQVSLV